MQRKSYMKASIFFMIALFLSALSAPMPAIAGAEALDAAGAAAGDTGDLAAKCPHCGGPITVGRHGQAGQTYKCPGCDREICPEPEEKEKGLCYGTDLAFMSAYVSRGVVTTDGFVFQPDAWVSYKGFTASVWGNMDMTDKNGLGGNFNELDFTLDHSGNITEKLGYSAGAVYYTFPHTGADDTAEVYLGLSYDVLLQPALMVYYDFWQADGFYASLSVGHSFELPEVVKGVSASLDLSAQLGLGSKNFNEFNFGASHTAFIDMVYTVAMPVSFTENLSLKPMVSYSSVLDRTIKSKNEKNDNVIAGIMFSASF